eukprot:CAMPEP_0171810724 /NCGR_PEP_ID=MMETSP0991-20121206/77718_1 /TAXON_ID=483369 /ORGANISM="non described non described, Strain CCMP2098" /LENGTH=253 /DNA_ID=CAMNT_0012424025 /DNA_START=300 /DNA_END=1061 /DNA_ORIENTATION=-
MAHQSCPVVFNSTCAKPAARVVLKQGCAQLTASASSVCEVATLKDHGPLLPEILPSVRQSARRLVIVMRHPTARVVSMFADSRHVVGLQGSAKRALNDAMLNRSDAACRHIRRSKQPQHKACDEAAAFSVFLRHPAASGCVAKTLVGKWCNDPFRVTEEELDLALQRLRLFAFVGIFERWDNTVHAFHRRLMGRPHGGDQVSSRPCDIELRHTRERPKEAAAVSAALEAETVVFQDRWDSPLYEEALKIFNNY